MSTKNTIKNLTAWIDSLKDRAKDNSDFDVAWFKDTEKEKFSIVGGWMESGFSDTDRDIFCISKSNPKYVMAIKIVINDGPYSYCDFESLNMPMDIDNPDKVDDTLFILEWDTDSESFAEFLYGELERITEAYGVRRKGYTNE